MSIRGQRRRERRAWQEMDRVLWPTKVLISGAVDAAIRYARSAPDIGTPPPTYEVVVALREAIAHTADASGLPRAACIDIISTEFEIQLCEKTLGELNVGAVGDLIRRAREVLSSALAQT